MSGLLNLSEPLSAVDVAFGGQRYQLLRSRLAHSSRPPPLCRFQLERLSCLATAEANPPRFC
jgi:hypothetical protein